MACECAICKNNKPFAFPKEIIDAALDGELKFQKQAKEIVKAKAGNGLIVHHPPY